MNKQISIKPKEPRKPGEPYLEIDSNGIMWEFIDLGVDEPCVLGMTDEELKQLEKNKND